MNAIKISSGLILLLTLNSLNAFAQEFTLTTTKANLVASKATIEVPALSGNPDAIIIATPVGEAETLNPHPIGAWYYNGKWNIFNTDHANMPEGLTYNVQYFLRRSANHFIHVMTKDSITGSVSVIDNPALNGNPNAQFKIFQNHAPNNRTASLNKYAAKAEYDSAAGRWYIKNVNGERLYPDTAYNIVITSAGTAGSNSPLPTTTPFVPVVGTTIAPVPVAPITAVVREEWDIPDQGNVKMSSGYCKRIDGAYNNSSIRGTDTVIVTGHSDADGDYLKWTATVSNGSIQLNVCNWKKMSLDTTTSLSLNGRRVNILVLR